MLFRSQCYKDLKLVRTSYAPPESKQKHGQTVQAGEDVRVYLARAMEGEFDWLHRQRGIYFYPVVSQLVDHDGFRSSASQYFRDAERGRTSCFGTDKKILGRPTPTA